MRRDGSFFGQKWLPKQAVIFDHFWSNGHSDQIGHFDQFGHFGQI